MYLFYTPDIHPTHLQFILPEEESKHAVRVLRLQAGDQIHLVDGKGGFYTTEILESHPKRTSLRVLDVQTDYGTMPYSLHIAIAPTKNMDRLEWFVEKATEVGIREITPIICEHSERKEVKVERLEKIAISAMKQSLKAYLPKINTPLSFDRCMIKVKDIEGSKGIAHCVQSEKTYISTAFTKRGNYLLLIGPEGDFSEKEISQALDAGCIPISLGDARLRTETAALATVLEISLLNR